MGFPMSAAVSTLIPIKPFAMLMPERLSEAALVALGAANPLLKFEQSSDGYLIVSPTGSSGNKGELRLVAQIVNWNDQVTFGEVRGLTGCVRLPAGGDYAPDVFIVSSNDWAGVVNEDRHKVYVPVLPTAIFELLSPSNKTASGFDSEFELKLTDCARSGVPLVVLLDPEQESTTIRRPGREDEVVAKSIVTFDELPGLALNVAAIFDACNNP
jgi:Uma2 family endonuclease